MNIVQFEYRTYSAGHLFLCFADAAETVEERRRMRELSRLFLAISDVAYLAAPAEIEAAAAREWRGPEDR